MKNNFNEDFFNHMCYDKFASDSDSQALSGAGASKVTYPFLTSSFSNMVPLYRCKVKPVIIVDHSHIKRAKPLVDIIGAVIVASVIFFLVSAILLVMP